MMRNRSTFVVAELAAFGEPLEIQWITRRIERNGWHIQVRVKGMETGKSYSVTLPFAHAIHLVPGAIYSEGKRIIPVTRGLLGETSIPNLREYTEVRLRDLPPSLFPSGKAPNSDQPILHYHIGKEHLYIPPLELIRRLFLMDVSLAHAIQKPGGLWDYMRPEEAGFFNEASLSFTSQMPPRTLTQPFLRKLAWIVFHPTGRRSWNSVFKISRESEWFGIEPPLIKDAKLNYRALRGDDAELVLEILSFRTLRDPVKNLSFSHPSLRKSSSYPKSASLDTMSATNHERPSGKASKTFVSKADGSRRNLHQDTVPHPDFTSDFDASHKKITRHLQPVENPRGPSGTHGSAGNYPQDAPEGRQGHSPKQKTVVTVAEVAIGGTLTPISFRRLEPLPTNALHGLTPLMMVLRRMKTLLPSVRIGATLCALPDFKPFGHDGSNRRAYLVAAFQAPKHPLTILIDVDRGPTMSLSALQLTTSKTLSEIEPVIHAIMRSLVERNGSWPSDSELIYPRVRLDRHPRLMREASKQRSNDYQSLWAETLIYKLGLSRFGGIQSHRS